MNFQVSFIWKNDKKCIWSEGSWRGNWLFICTVWHLIGHIKLTYITSYQNRKVNISLFDLHFLSFSKTRVLEKCFVQTNKQSVIASKVVTSEVLFHFYVVCVVTLYIFHWKFYILRVGYVQLDNSCVSWKIYI